MAWWGTGIGAGIGMMLGGPFGALIGAGIGSSMTREDRGYERGYDRGYDTGGSRLETEQQQQIGFLVAAFSMIGKIAKADGVVSPDEVAFVETFIKKELDLDAKSRKVAIEIFNRAKSDSTPIYQYAEQFVQMFRYEDAMRETIYRVLFMTAMADGQLHPAEKDILQNLPPVLRLRENIYQQFEAEFGGDLAGYYALLGCSNNATDAEIKSAYRKKCLEYHPDKLASKGLPDGFTKFATDQMTQFSEAYDKIMKSRKK